MPPIDLQANDTGDDSIRSMLSAAMDEPATATPSTESAVSEPAISPADTPDAAADPSPVQAASTPKADHPTDPNRYVDGTYKTKKTEAAPEKAAPVKTDDPSKDTTKASTVPASTPASAPPAGWTAAEKAEWTKTPPAVQAAVSRREVEMSNGGKQWSEEKRRYEAMIAPIAEMARLRGIDPAQGLQRLAEAQRALDTDAPSAIRRIAQQYGVDLATLAGTQAANGSPEQSQPNIADLVRQAVQPIVAPIHERYAAEDRARQQESVDFVTTFAQSAGHEHFDAVQNELMAMIPAIKAENPLMSREKVLQEAYDRATFANPTTRTAILTQRETEAEAKRNDEAKRRAEAARKAGSSVTGAPSAGGPSAVPRDSLRAELEAAFAGA